MLDYFKAELLRFRAWAIAYFLLHLAVLGFLNRVIDLAQQPAFVYQVFGAVYGLSGLLLGAYQMGNYRKPNAWLNLLHRPIAHRRLAAALMLAAAMLLLCAVLLPMLLAAAWQHGMTARVLDLRHLGLALSAWMVAVCGYLAGAYALLANRRYAVAAGVFVLALCEATATGAGALLLQAMLIAWLCAMVLVSFKPDLAAPPRGLAATVVVAAPLHMAMWFALVLAAFGCELVWIVQGTHPNNLPVPIPGSAKEADNATARDLLIAGLSASRLPQAGLWKEQAAISDVYTISPDLGDLPVRNQLMNPAPLEFDDDVRRVRWVFSHDHMRFQGYTVVDQHAAGTLAIAGGKRFPQPVLPVADGMLATRTAVYQFDGEGNRILPRATLPPGEVLVGMDKAGDRIGLLSQRALYLYDLRDLQASDALLTPRLRIPMPGRAGALTRVELMELVDGAVVSFTFTRGRHDGGGHAYQQVLRVGEDGTVQAVARRGLPSGYGALYTYSNWYTSPILHAVQARAMRLFSGYVLEHDAVRPPVPRLAWTVALVLSLLSLLGALWRTRRLALSPVARAAWVATCAVLSVPALLSLWLLYPPRERLAASPRRAPAAALAALLVATGMSASPPGTAVAPDAQEIADARGLHAFGAAERARAVAPRLARVDVLAKGVLRAATLSPDGRQVAALLDDGRMRSVRIATRAAPAGSERLARTAADSIAWSHDGRWLFVVEPSRVLAVAADGRGQARGVATIGGRTHRAFAGVDPWLPAAVLLLETPPASAPAPRRFRLWRAQAGGRLTLLHEGGLQIVEFAFSPAGRLSHLLLAVGEGHALLKRKSDGGWRAIAMCRHMQRCQFVGTTHGGQDLLLRSDLGGDLLQLLRLGPDGQRSLVHADPQGVADLDEVVLDPRDNRPLFAAYRSTVARNHGLEPAAEAAAAALQRQFPGRNLRLEVGRGVQADWLVHERGGDLRGERLHLVDPARPADAVELFAQLGAQAQAQARPRPRLPDAALARQRAVRWRASDGMPLHGFLVLPAGVDAAHAPLVVLVHGGPFNHVQPEFNSHVQFLANLGYAVFLPNFRSSTGFGRRLVFAGRGDFGGNGRVQRDIVEGTRWLLANGIGDPARVGIVGASFGGYATLLGVTFQPDLFRVGIASVPPSDFAFVMREYLGANKPMVPGVDIAASLRDLGLDPADAALAARLRAGSPQAHAAAMARPLLLLAGGEDDRVPIRGVTHYAATLQQLGKDVSLFVDDGASHHLADPRTLEAYLYLEQAMLARALGGPAPAPPDAALREHLARNLRLRGKSLSAEAFPLAR
jgi:dipeptidyl aminopeptidase/acylaminoacyl peptidase